MESVTTLQINFECQAKSIYPADPQEIINQLQILTKHLHYAINRKQNLNLDLGLHNKQIQTNSLGDLIKSLTNGFDFIDYVAIDKKDYPAKKINRQSVYFQLIENRFVGYINKNHLCLRWIDDE